MIGQVLLEGFGLGVLLMLVCIPGYLAYVLVFCLPCSSRHLLSYRSGLVPRSAVSATRSLRRA